MNLFHLRPYRRKTRVWPHNRSALMTRVTTAPHRFSLRVHYEDTDLSGFVYHANYLKFIERARSDWVLGLGVDQNCLKEQGLVFAVRKLEADFLAPARLEDRLTVETRLIDKTPARLVLAQDIVRGEERLFEAKVTLVCMSLSGRPRRLPKPLRAEDLG